MEEKPNRRSLPSVAVASASAPKGNPTTYDEVVDAAIASSDEKFRATFDRLVRATPHMLGL